MATNGYLQKVNREFEVTLSSLRSATSKVGGWETALIDARAAAPSEETDTVPSGIGSSGSEVGTPSLGTELGTQPDGTTRTIIDGDMAAALRKRLLNVPQNGTSVPSVNGSKVYMSNGSNKSHDEPDYAVLAHHPEKEISGLAIQLLDMDDELTSNGEERIRWPDNISIGRFATYMLIPTLVYELEYPRTKKYVVGHSPY